MVSGHGAAPWDSGGARGFGGWKGWGGNVTEVGVGLALGERLRTFFAQNLCLIEEKA